MPESTRRDFIKTAGATVAVAALAPTALATRDETKTDAMVVDAKDAPHWRPFVYTIIKRGHIWWPIKWEDLKPDDIVRWVSPDDVVEHKGTEREIQIVTGEPFKTEGIWGIECRPFTVIRLGSMAGAMRLSVWKDRKQVPLVQEVDLRTHMMKRIPLNDWRLDHFRCCTEPGYCCPKARKQAADYDLIEEPFDYIRRDGQKYGEWHHLPLTVAPPNHHHVLSLERDFVLREVSSDAPGKTVGIAHDVESDDEGFTAGLMYLTLKHLNERWSESGDSQLFNYAARLVYEMYDFQSTKVVLAGWDRSFLKDGVFIIEGARLRKMPA